MEAGLDEWLSQLRTITRRIAIEQQHIQEAE
jgi:hypothetical protein